MTTKIQRDILRNTFIANEILKIKVNPQEGKTNKQKTPKKQSKNKQGTKKGQTIKWQTQALTYQ